MKELLDKLLQRHKYLEPTAEEELRRQEAQEARELRVLAALKAKHEK